MAATATPIPSNGGLPTKPNDWVCQSSLIPATPQEMRTWCETNPDRGTPLPLALRHPPPLSDLTAKNEYDLRLGAFLKTLRYKHELAWISDPAWRFTGPIVGPIDGGSSYATHLPVRVFYSPEVIDWLCEGRKGELPDGATIIKEMRLISSLDIDLDDEGCMVINSELPDHDIIPQAWVPMSKNSGQSKDGWYWAAHQIELTKDVAGAIVDPPILDRTGIVRRNFFDNGLIPTEPDPRWYPSGYWPNNKQKYPNVIMPQSTYGGFCLSCHASAEQDFTYASLDNILGKFIRYKQFDADYQDPRRTGADQIDYLISLDAAALDEARTVEVTLYNQSIPPFYLQQRFRDAAHDIDKSDEIQRLYYMTSHLNLDGDGQSEKADVLQNWKLRVGGAQLEIPHRDR
jgi:hypothetical protein